MISEATEMKARAGLLAAQNIFHSEQAHIKTAFNGTEPKYLAAKAVDEALFELGSVAPKERPIIQGQT